MYAKNCGGAVLGTEWQRRFNQRLSKKPGHSRLEHKYGGVEWAIYKLPILKADHTLAAQLRRLGLPTKHYRPGDALVDWQREQRSSCVTDKTVARSRRGDELNLEHNIKH
jgi:hypothetical protein